MPFSHASTECGCAGLAQEQLTYVNPSCLFCRRMAFPPGMVECSWCRIESVALADPQPPAGIFTSWVWACSSIGVFLQGTVKLVYRPNRKTTATSRPTNQKTQTNKENTETAQGQIEAADFVRADFSVVSHVVQRRSAQPERIVRADLHHLPTLRSYIHVVSLSGDVQLKPEAVPGPARVRDGTERAVSRAVVRINASRRIETHNRCQARVNRLSPIGQTHHGDDVVARRRCIEFDRWRSRLRCEARVRPGSRGRLAHFHGVRESIEQGQ